MGSRIVNSLWLIEVDPHRSGSISLRPVAAPHAYPVFGRTTADQAIALPTKADLLWMEGALGALLAYLGAQREVDQGQGQPAALTVSVPRVDGEANVHLRLLAFEAIVRQDLGV